MISTPWAVLLCKFNDNTSPDPHDRKYYEDLFTNPDPRAMGMVHFFRTMSHGKIDLKGTRIFPSKEIGWYTVDASYKDYRNLCDTPACGGLYDPDPAKRPSSWKHPRNELQRWAIEAANREIDASSTYDPDRPIAYLDKFFGVVVVYNIGAVDTFGGPSRVVCDEYTVKPSVLGQEMGHGYGLPHSKRDGSEEEYQDPWDIMSTLNAYTAGHLNYDSIGEPPGLTVCDNNPWADTYGKPVPAGQTRGQSIGPGLNAAMMDNYITKGEKWIDTERLVNISPGKTVIDLRPLHHLDLDGPLAILVAGYYVEFRMNTGWDAGFSSPVVLIHYFRNNTSYVVSDKTGNSGLTKGSIFETEIGSRFGLKYHLKIEVLDIDVSSSTAKISIDYSSPITKRTFTIDDPRHIFPWEYESPAIPSEGLSYDISILSDMIKGMPSWSLGPILRSLADISSSDRFNNQDIRRAIREDSLEAIIKVASQELSHLRHIGGIVHAHDSDKQSEHQHDN